MSNDTVWIKTSYLRRSVCSHKENVKTTASLAPLVNLSVCLSNFIARITWNTKYWRPSGCSISTKNIFALGVKLKSKISSEKLDIHLLQSRKRAEVKERRANLPALLISCPLRRKTNCQLIQLNRGFRFNHTFSIDSDPISTYQLENRQIRKWNPTHTCG